MNSALTASRRMVLLTTTRVSTRKFASLRPVLAAGGQQQAYNTNTEANKQSWTAVAALVAGAFLGTSSIAACDAAPPTPVVLKKKTNVIDPQTYPTPDFKDEQVVRSSSSSNDENKQTVTATSPTEERKNMRLEEQKQTIAKAGTALPEMTPEEFVFEKATKKAKQHSGGLKLFSGNGNLALSLEICRYLGINLGKATVGRFADGEVNVVVHENVRGKDCYVIQPTCPPVNDNIMELLLMVSTLRRASARRITVVIPYYGYARQDRKMQVRIHIRFEV